MALSNRQGMRICGSWLNALVLSLVLAGCTSSDDGKRERMVNLQEVTVEDPEKQLESLSAAIDRSKRDGSLYARRAMVLLRQGALSEALEDVDMAISLSQNEPAYYFAKAQVLYLQGKPAEALRFALQSERNSYQSASLYVLLSELYLQQQDYKQAGWFIQKAMELSPDDQYTLYHLGRLQEETGDTARAFQSYAQALEQSQDFMEPHRELTGLYLARQEMEAAGTHLKKAMAMVADDPYLWYYKGMLQLHNQRKDSATVSFEKAVSLRDSLQGAHYQLALLMHAQGNYEAVLQHLEQSREAYGNKLKYLSVKASSYERLGENLAALRTYERMVALEPKHGYAAQSVARLRYKLERPRPLTDSLAVRRPGY